MQQMTREAIFISETKSYFLNGNKNYTLTNPSGLLK